MGPVGGLGHEDGAPWMALVPLQEQTWNLALALLFPPYEEHKKSATHERALSRTYPRWDPDLRPPASRSGRNKCLSLISSSETVCIAARVDWGPWRWQPMELFLRTRKQGYWCRWPLNFLRGLHIKTLTLFVQSLGVYIYQCDLHKHTWILSQNVFSISMEAQKTERW